MRREDANREETLADAEEVLGSTKTPKSLGRVLEVLLGLKWQRSRLRPMLSNAAPPPVRPAACI